MKMRERRGKDKKQLKGPQVEKEAERKGEEGERETGEKNETH